MMDPLIKKMIEAYYPGEPAEELAWNEPDMRQVLKVVIEDMREWATPVYTENLEAFHKTLDAYEKKQGESEGPCEHVPEFIWGDGHNGHWACKKCGERVPSSLPQGDRL